MATYMVLAAIFRNPTNNDQFLLVKQNPPPKYDHQEYDSYVDSHLWDLPSAKLSHQPDSSTSSKGGEEEDASCSHNLNLREFDLNSALAEVLKLVGASSECDVECKFLKFEKEPNFGPPGFTTTTTGTVLYVTGDLFLMNADDCQWSCKETCFKLLLEVKPGGDRVGPLAVNGPLKDSLQSNFLKLPPTLRCQEYPPGVNIIPMGSRTAKPYRTTNLIVFAPGNNGVVVKYEGSNFVAHGDAMIVDPGCQSEFDPELREIVASLPQKLLVFVTHHHRDHVDDDWSSCYTTVSGTEEICIGGERLKIVFAPGHTDGHLALLHVSTNSLIVGDHCVGQGSALLDINSGGNMSDYFQTTYKFMDLSPNALISMHGRINLWPKHMLCGYLKNRRNREDTILKAIEAGTKTLFDIVAHTYADVDRSLWVHAASNVRLHVDHLDHQNKLPKDFCLENFNNSCSQFTIQVGKL